MHVADPATDPQMTIDPTVGGVRRFRKRPVAIEAICFNGNNFFEVARFLGHGPDVLDNLELKATDHPIVATLEGNMEAKPGDWIIRGVQGEYYPIKHEILEATYEEI